MLHTAFIKKLISVTYELSWTVVILFGKFCFKISSESKNAKTSAAPTKASGVGAQHSPIQKGLQKRKHNLKINCIQTHRELPNHSNCSAQSAQEDDCLILHRRPAGTAGPA